MDFSEKLCPPAAARAAEDRLGGDLKETELRLGLPGSESPDRKDWDQAVLVLGPPKGVVSGAKRGFSDAIDGSNQWLFPGGLGSEVEPGKGGLFAPKGDAIGGQLPAAVNGAKDAGSASKAAGFEKKGATPSGEADRRASHAAK